MNNVILPKQLYYLQWWGFDDYPCSKFLVAESTEQAMEMVQGEMKEKNLPCNNLNMVCVHFVDEYEIKPTKEQEAIIAKELKDAVNWRSGCQVANLGVSLILLGLIVPLWTRRSTKKKHAEALMQMQEANSDKGIDVNDKSLELQKAQV